MNPSVFVWVRFPKCVNGNVCIQGEVEVIHTKQCIIPVYRRSCQHVRWSCFAQGGKSTWYSTCRSCPALYAVCLIPCVHLNSFLLQLIPVKFIIHPLSVIRRLPLYIIEFLELFCHPQEMPRFSADGRTLPAEWEKLLLGSRTGFSSVCWASRCSGVQ